MEGGNATLTAVITKAARRWKWCYSNCHEGKPKFSRKRNRGKQLTGWRGHWNFLPVFGPVDVSFPKHCRTCPFLPVLRFSRSTMPIATLGKRTTQNFNARYRHGGRKWRGIHMTQRDATRSSCQTQILDSSRSLACSSHNGHTHSRLFWIPTFVYQTLQVKGGT